MHEGFITYRFVGKPKKFYIIDMKENMNNCHNPPGPGGGQFCEGGGSGSGAGGSYMPLNRSGYVSAGTFLAHKVITPPNRITIEEKSSYMQNEINKKLDAAKAERDPIKKANLTREASLMQKSLKKSIADHLRHSRNKQANDIYNKK